MTGVADVARERRSRGCPAASGAREGSARERGSRGRGASGRGASGRGASAGADAEWLTIHEASALVGVSVATLRRWCDAGTVRAFTTPGGHRRFDRTAVLGLIPGVPLERPTIAGLGGTDVSITRSFRRSLARGGVWPPSIETLPACAREPFRECGRRMVTALVAYLDAPRGKTGDRLGAAAECAAVSYGRVAAGNHVPIADTIALFLRFRAPFLHELGALARRRALDATEAIGLLEAASDALDRLLPAVVAGHEAAGEAMSAPLQRPA